MPGAWLILELNITIKGGADIFRCAVSTPGDGGLKRAGNSSSLSVPGSRRLVDYTRCTTCGNIRSCYNLPQCRASADGLVRSDLHTRKETRETAWQLDGWSETVAKVRSFACAHWAGREQD